MSRCTIWPDLREETAERFAVERERKPSDSLVIQGRHGIP